MGSVGKGQGQGSGIGTVGEFNPERDAMDYLSAYTNLTFDSITGKSKKPDPEEVEALLNKYLNAAEQGKLPVDKEDVDDLQDVKFGIKTKDFSDEDKNNFILLLYSTTKKTGKSSKNSFNEAANVGTDKAVQINISQLTSNELKDFIKLASKSDTHASVMAVSNALKLLSYHNQ